MTLPGLVHRLLNRVGRIAVPLILGACAQPSFEVTRDADPVVTASRIEAGPGTVFTIGLAPPPRAGTHGIRVRVGTTILEPLWHSAGALHVMMPFGATGPDRLSVELAHGPQVEFDMERVGRMDLRSTATALHRWAVASVELAIRMVEDGDVEGWSRGIQGIDRQPWPLDLLVAFGKLPQTGGDPRAQDGMEGYAPPTGAGADPCWAMIGGAMLAPAEPEPHDRPEDWLQQARVLHDLVGQLAVRAEGFARLAATRDTWSATVAAVSAYGLRRALPLMSAVLPSSFRGAWVVDESNGPLRSLAHGQFVQVRPMLWFGTRSFVPAEDWEQHWRSVFVGGAVRARMAARRRAVADWIKQFEGPAGTSTALTGRTLRVSEPEFPTRSAALERLSTLLPLDASSADECLARWAPPALEGRVDVAAPAGGESGGVEVQGTAQGADLRAITPGPASLTLSLAGAATMYPFNTIGASIDPPDEAASSWQVPLSVLEP